MVTLIYNERTYQPQAENLFSALTGNGIKAYCITHALVEAGMLLHVAQVYEQRATLLSQLQACTSEMRRYRIERLLSGRSRPCARLMFTCFVDCWVRRQLKLTNSTISITPAPKCHPPQQRWCMT